MKVNFFFFLIWEFLSQICEKHLIFALGIGAEIQTKIGLGESLKQSRGMLKRIPLNESGLFRPRLFRPIFRVGRFGLGRWVLSAHF